MNLITDPWIPVSRLSGTRTLIRPCEVTDGHATDPVVDVTWPRPDLRLAQYEFLIGLLSTAMSFPTTSEWRKRWDAPPATEELEAAFAPYASFFEVDGHGPRFMQDLHPLDADPVAIARLLIDQPGGNTTRQNSDLFTKRGRIPVMGLSTAAISLMCLQANAPSGGQGHRTGMRGGGPIVTLALPPGQVTLWHRLWLNVVMAYDVARDGASIEDPSRVFPWLAPTRTSVATGRGQERLSGLRTTPADVHPAQCWWGMPRRIRLDVEDNNDDVPCAVTGRVESRIVRSYATQNFGVDYYGFLHPLTPHYHVEKTGEWLPFHVQPDTDAYRNWATFTLPAQEGGRKVKLAQSVVQARERLRRVHRGSHARVLALGYDMDNMKARGFIEATAPLHNVPEERLRSYEMLVASLLGSSEEAAALVGGQIYAAHAGQATGEHRAAFRAMTETQFWEVARSAADSDGSDDPERLKSWIERVLRPAGEALFEREAPPVDASDEPEMRRRANASKNVRMGLRGYGNDGRRIYEAARLAPPETAKQKSAKAKGGKSNMTEEVA